MVGRRERVGAASGVLFVVLVVVSILVPGSSPGGDDDAAEFVEYFEDKQDAIIYGNGLVSVFIAGFFVLFLAGLYARLRESEPGRCSWLAVTAFAGGVVQIVLSLMATAAQVAYPAARDFYDAFETDPQLAMVLGALAFWLYVFAAVGNALLTGAAATLALKNGVLPRSVAYLGMVSAALSALALFTFFAAAIVFLIWVLAVCVVLVSPPREPASPPAPA